MGFMNGIKIKVRKIRDWSDNTAADGIVAMALWPIRIR